VWLKTSWRVLRHRLFKRSYRVLAVADHNTDSRRTQLVNGIVWNRLPLTITCLMYEHMWSRTSRLWVGDLTHCAYSPTWYFSDGSWRFFPRSGRTRMRGSLKPSQTYLASMFPNYSISHAVVETACCGQPRSQAQGKGTQLVAWNQLMMRWGRDYVASYLAIPTLPQSLATSRFNISNTESV
jgi:hypothetical protein